MGLPNQGTPEAPHGNFLSQGNELSHEGHEAPHRTDQEPHVSTGASGTETTNTNTNFSLRHKHNINITNKIEEEKRDAPASSSGNRGYRSTVWVDRDSWQKFISLCKDLGYSASEVINSFINSVISNSGLQMDQRRPLTFNVAIAKAESKPVVNVGEYIARKELDELLEKARRLKDRAEREKRSSDMPLVFTAEQAKKLEESIKKSLKEARHVGPEKLQEVEAALSILKSIREGKP